MKAPRGRQSPNTGRDCDRLASAKEIRTGWRSYLEGRSKDCTEGFLSGGNVLVLYPLTLFGGSLVQHCTQSTGAGPHKRAAHGTTCANKEPMVSAVWLN